MFILCHNYLVENLQLFQAIKYVNISHAIQKCLETQYTFNLQFNIDLFIVCAFLLFTPFLNQLNKERKCQILVFPRRPITSSKVKILADFILHSECASLRCEGGGAARGPD